MNPLQKAAVRRKVYYLGAILGLFTLSMFWRGMIPVPLSNTARAGEPPTALHRAAEALMCHLREERAGHAEDHRDQVDDERHQHDGITGEVAEAVQHGTESHAG